MFLRKIDLEDTNIWMEKLEAWHELVGAWNVGCSAQRSHLYLTGGTDQCLEFQVCSHGFPREKEFDFWDGFSRNKNTPHQRSASGSNTGDRTQQDADDRKGSPSSVPDAQQILVCWLLI